MIITNVFFVHADDIGVIMYRCFSCNKKIANWYKESLLCRTCYMEKENKKLAFSERSKKKSFWDNFIKRCFYGFNPVFHVLYGVRFWNIGHRQDIQGLGFT